jgi:NAD(P)-dependent dehydrogenase (short-subunit alcohol dehydrogenase family)
MRSHVYTATQFVQDVSTSPLNSLKHDCLFAKTQNPVDTDTAIFKTTTKTVDPETIAAMHPLRGVGRPEDVAGGAIFLASDEARWITGTCLSIDGGFVAK